MSKAVQMHGKVILENVNGVAQNLCHSGNSKIPVPKVVSNHYGNKGENK